MKEKSAGNSSFLILLPDLRGGGAERLHLDLAAEFRALGYDVTFALMQAEGELLEQAECDFGVENLGVSRMRGLPLAFAACVRRLKPDFIIAAMWPLTVIAPWARQLSRHRCRVLVSEHNPLSIQYRKWGARHRATMRTSMALGYRLADVRVGVSRGTALDMARLSGLKQDSIDVIHNPVKRPDNPGSQELFEAEALWPSARGARLLSVASLKDQKNHVLLLEAFARLEAKGASLVVLGDGPNKDMLQRKANELGISKQVIFAGFKVHTAAFYQTADVFVLASDYEGFGNVLVEALSFGLPVVSTDCPHGPAEILGDGAWGRLVPVGDSCALAAAMRGALGEKSDEERLRERASSFDPPLVARRYLDALGCP